MQLSTNILQEFIQAVLHESRSKVATMSAGYANDLEQGLYWLKNNKVLKSASAISKSDNKYTVRIKFKGSKPDIKKLIDDRFGKFVRIQ